MIRLIALLAALGFAAPAWAQSNKPPSAIGAVFKDVCMDNRKNAFAEYEDTLPGWGYEKDGIYWINAQKDTFQLYNEKGIRFCVFFYTRASGDVADWTIRVMSEIYPPSVDRFGKNFKDGTYFDDIGLLERMPLQHTLMEERNGIALYRVMVGVPEQ